MTSLSSTQSFIRISLAGGLALGLATLAGCGVGLMSSNTTTDTIGARTAGTVHGGPNPVAGATVTLYATGASGGASTNYGVGTALQTATSDAGGNFQFAGGYTCPAGQFAYAVATGGKTGANSVNPNSVLLDALGPCANLSSSTFILINELTTVAAGYTLSNFINVTGDAVHGYVVGIGAPPTNNAPAGCVSNSFYGTGTCPATSAAGLAHAFANAAMLVGTSSGQVNSTSPTGAIIPAQFINTLGNVLQACVNSNGGGTDLTAGTPTTTTSTAGGTTDDGTPCGMLFAFTSYTSDGTATGTLNAPGNTLAAIQNLAKRPNGSSTMFNNSCASGSTGTTPAATCIFNLATPIGIYQTSMTSAPPDWMLGIAYPIGSFATASNAVTCAGSPTTNGLLYPYYTATDINDNITILNEDNSKGTCFNLLTVGFDGTPIGGNGFDASTAAPLVVATDTFGHAIIPTSSTTGGPNGVEVYTAASNEGTITLVANINSTILPAAATASYVAVDSSDDIYVSSGNKTNPIGVAKVSGAESHSTPTYTGTDLGTSTSTTRQNVIDIHGNDFTGTSSSSGTGRLWGVAPGEAAFVQSGTLGGTTSNGSLVPDTNSNVWAVVNNCSGSGCVPTSTAMEKVPYTYTTTAITWPTTPPGVTTPTYSFAVPTLSPTNATIDGNNVVWFAERGNAGTSGATATSGHIRGYDTINNYGTPQLMGCKFLNTSSTVCGSTDPVTASATPYLAYMSRGVTIDAAGDMWVANGTQGTVSEIFGLAAPTWPLFIHNGTSNLP